MSLVRSSDWLELIYDIAFGVYIISCGRFPFRKKNPEISVGAKVEFPIGKKLFHLVLNPGTSRCPTVDLELVQTTRNVNGTRHSVRKFQPGKRAHLFRFSTFSGNFPVGRADETCSIYRRTRNSGNFRLHNSPYFCLFKYTRAVKQKVSNKTENRERDWLTYATLYRFLYWFWGKNRLFCSLRKFWLNGKRPVFLTWPYLCWFILPLTNSQRSLFLHRFAIWRLK